MNNEDKRGFSLIEIIITVLIFCFVMVIGVSSYRAVNKNIKDSKIQTYTKTIESAAKLYIDNNEQDLFSNTDNVCYDIKYDYLQKKNLIDDIDFKSLGYKKSEVFIRITKDNNEYQYKVFFTTPKDNSPCNSIPS